MGDSDTEKYLTGRVSGYGEGQIYPARYPARPTYLKTVARNFAGKQRPETLLENRGQKHYWKTEARNFTGKQRPETLLENAAVQMSEIFYYREQNMSL